MTELHKKYLKLAIVEQKKFDEIAQILQIDRKRVSELWGELKEPREKLSELRKIWKSKFEETTNTESFWKFKEWYEKTERKCFYCGITESQISELFDKGALYTKRNRGRKLEIERLSPNEPYENLKNLVFSCYWCNNAKTDTFTSEEFKNIGKEIGKIWEKRLKYDK